MIIPFALRLAARRALTGATLAEARIQDSAITALDDLAKAEPQPFIIVSTDEQTFDLAGLDITAGTRQCDVVLDIAVAQSTQTEQGEIEVSVPHTDAGLELTVNLITRQALRALFEPTSGGAWGAMFRKIGGKVRRISVRRGAGTKGVRFAAAQIVITLETISEPPFGKQPEFVWAEFMAAVRADPMIAPQAALIEAIIVGAELPEWRQSTSVLGIDDVVASEIGIFPLGVVNGLPSDFSGLGVVPDGWVIDDAEAEEQLPPIPDEP